MSNKYNVDHQYLRLSLDLHHERLVDFLHREFLIDGSIYLSCSTPWPTVTGGTYRYSFLAKENTKSTRQAFQAEKVVAIRWDIDFVDYFI